MKTSANLLLEWSDSFLKWEDDTKYDDIDSIMAYQRDLWLPDVVVANSVKKHEQLG